MECGRPAIRDLDLSSNRLIGSIPDGIGHVSWLGYVVSDGVDAVVVCAGKVLCSGV